MPDGTADTDVERLARRAAEMDDAQLADAALAMAVAGEAVGLARLVERFGPSSDDRLRRAVAYVLARAAWGDPDLGPAVTGATLRFVALTTASPDPDVLAGIAVAFQGLDWSGGLALSSDEERESVFDFVIRGLHHPDANVRDACCCLVEQLESAGTLAGLFPCGPADALRARVGRLRDLSGLSA